MQFNRIENTHVRKMLNSFSKRSQILLYNLNLRNEIDKSSNYVCHELK